MNERSRARLAGVHPDLIRVLEHAKARGAPRFEVIEGVRSPFRQAQMVQEGRSRTYKSRHLTGHAVDLMAFDAAGQVTWDWPAYEAIAQHIRAAAEHLGIRITWGGDWRMRDGVHFELHREAYPA